MGDNKEAFDWYAQKTKGERKPLSRNNPANLYWKDVITGTSYCIPKSSYESVYADGCKILRQYAAENQFEEMEKFLYDKEEQAENSASLFLSLPYQNEGNIFSYRICDFILLRTAILYCMRYPEISRLAGEEKKKAVQEIRMYGLAWKYGIEENPYKELEQIEQFLLQPEKENGIVSDLKIDLVKGGMVKIKQYYLETSSLPEIRGASRLLDLVNEEKMQESICGSHIRECLIYAGGGKMLGIFPAGCGGQICRDMEREVEKWTVSAQSNFSSMECSMKALHLEACYQAIMDQMDVQLEQRQGLRWDFRIEPQMPDGGIIEDKKEKFAWLPKEDKPTICASCNHRYARAKLVNVAEKRNVCPSCLCKNLSGGREAKDHILEEYASYVHKKYPDAAIKKDKKCTTLEAIGEGSKGFIGVIYGDANNMSKVFGAVHSLMQMKYLSEEMSDTVTDIVFDALYQNLGEMPSFEIIAVGGDDIFLIVPGNRAYDIACTLGKEFDKRFQNQTEDNYNVTMSLGVCITHYDKPLQYVFDIALQLLHSAKKKAWRENGAGREIPKDAKKQDRKATGTLDFMVIENDIAGGSSLKAVRKEIPGKALKTLRPYTWATADAVKKFILDIQDEKASAFQFRQSWYMHGKEEGNLFYQYQLARKEDGGRKAVLLPALVKLAEQLGENQAGRQGHSAKEHPPWIEIEGKDYTPWLDVIELWDYVKGVRDGEG